MTMKLNHSVPDDYGVANPLKVPDSHDIGAVQGSHEGSQGFHHNKAYMEDLPNRQTEDQASDTIEERIRWLLFDLYLPESMRNATREEKIEYRIRENDIENRQRWGNPIVAIIFANLLTTACNSRHRREASKSNKGILQQERRTWKVWFWKRALNATDRFPWTPRMQPIGLWTPTRWGVDSETTQSWFIDLETRHPAWMVERQFTWDEWEHWNENQLDFILDVMKNADIAWRMYLFPLFSTSPCFALITLALGFKVSGGLFLMFVWLLWSAIGAIGLMLIECVYLMHLRLLGTMSKGLMCLLLLHVVSVGVLMTRVDINSPGQV